MTRLYTQLLEAAEITLFPLLFSSWLQTVHTRNPKYASPGPSLFWAHMALPLWGDHLDLLNSVGECTGWF